MTVAISEVKGNTKTSWLEKNVLQTTWHGRVDADMMSALLSDMRGALADRTARYWFSNTSDVSNYSVDIRQPSIDLLSYLKTRGCEEVVGVVGSSAIRMLATSLSFVVGLRVRLFGTEQEALAYLHSQAKEN